MWTVHSGFQFRNFMEHFLFYLFWRFELAIRGVDIVSYLVPHFEACSTCAIVNLWVHIFWELMEHFLFYLLLLVWTLPENSENHCMIVNFSMHRLYIFLFLKLALKGSISLYNWPYNTIVLVLYGHVPKLKPINDDDWVHGSQFTLWYSLVFHPPLVYSK